MAKLMKDYINQYVQTLDPTDLWENRCIRLINEQLIPLVGERYPEDLDPDTIWSILSPISHISHAKASILLTILKRILNLVLLEADATLKVNPAAYVVLPPRPVVPGLSKEEFLRFLEVSERCHNPNFLPVVAYSLQSTNVVRALCLRDIDFEHCILRLTHRLQSNAPAILTELEPPQIVAGCSPECFHYLEKQVGLLRQRNEDAEYQKHNPHQLLFTNRYGACQLSSGYMHLQIRNSQSRN